MSITNRGTSRAVTAATALIALGCFGSLGSCEDPTVAGPDLGALDAGPGGNAPDAGLDAAAGDAALQDAGVPVPITWVPLPAGSFTMGSPESEPCRFVNEVQHEVTLSHAFVIASTEITQGQFEELMGYNPSHFGPNGIGNPCGADCPVEMVSWHEAAAFCNALSAGNGVDPCYLCTGSGSSVTCQEAPTYSGQQVYSCPGYRLPTEAEWEYAYRAGTKTALYSGDSDPELCTSCTAVDPNADAIGWYCANSGYVSHPVAQKQPNAWSVYDMAGSLWEWNHDWYQSNLGTDPVKDPWGAPIDVYRVVRGGSWYFGDSVNFMRAAFRDRWIPAYRVSALGFRCSRSQ